MHTAIKPGRSVSCTPSRCTNQTCLLLWQRQESTHIRYAVMGQGRTHEHERYTYSYRTGRNCWPYLTKQAEVMEVCCLLDPALCSLRLTISSSVSVSWCLHSQQEQQLPSHSPNVECDAAVDARALAFRLAPARAGLGCASSSESSQLSFLPVDWTWDECTCRSTFKLMTS